jgi:hypothetical protein
MIHLEKPADSPAPYCIVELSDGRNVYEANRIQFWRTLKKFCTDGDLSVKRLYIMMSSGRRRTIKRNNATRYFMVYRGIYSAKTAKKKDVKKGYGVICVHPGGIEKSYVDWYNDETGEFAYTEVFRGSERFHKEELGIPACH